MANLLFSVLCNLGVVDVKAAGLIFSNCKVLGFFYMGSQQKKESKAVMTELFISCELGQRRAPGPQTQVMGSSLSACFM